jgi:hypothetical protein
MKHITLTRILSVLVMVLTVALVWPKSKPVEVVAPVAEPVVIDNRIQDVQDLANANGFKPSERIVKAILEAADTYSIDALELTAIAIVETGLGKYAKTHRNSNGTLDKGLFQINTVNESQCIEYNLESPEGSSLCAAKLLSQIRTRHADYLGRYHSKTPVKKVAYMQKVSKVLASTSDKE